MPGFPWRRRPSLSWCFARCRGRAAAEGAAAGRRGQAGGVAGQLSERWVPAAEAPSAPRPWRWPLARRSPPQVWMRQMKKERPDRDEFVKSEALFPSLREDEILNSLCSARPLSSKFFYFNNHFAAVSARISWYHFADMTDIGPPSRISRGTLKLQAVLVSPWFSFSIYLLIPHVFKAYISVWKEDAVELLGFFWRGAGSWCENPRFRLLWERDNH